MASPLHNGALRTALDDATAAELDALERTVRRLDDDPVVADLSIHVLAVGLA